MNDPHVVALNYRIKEPSEMGTKYNNPPPLDVETNDFKVTVNNGRARFEPKHHFATTDDAIECATPFIRAWELSAGLEERRHPGEFILAFERAEVIDRNPLPSPPGTHRVTIDNILNIEASVKASVLRATYPSPEPGLAVTPQIELMYERYTRYKDNRELLPNTANFCLTTIYDLAGGIKRAAQYLHFDEAILKVLSKLVAEKGGTEARKGKARHIPFTAAERAWIEAVTRAIIRRAAQIAFNPAGGNTTITMSDFPQL